MARGFENNDANSSKYKKKKKNASNSKPPQANEKFSIVEEPVQQVSKELDTSVVSDAKITEKLREMGVQGVVRDKRRPIIPEAQIGMEKKKDMSINFFDLIPVEFQGILEKFLSLGVTLCLLFFIASGLALGIEAYAVTSKSPLPPQIDDAIVNYLEPAFTPSLFVLLAFSSMLGIFKIGQLGKSGANYKE